MPPKKVNRNKKPQIQVKRTKNKKRANVGLSKIGQVMVRAGNTLGNYLSAGVFPRILGSGAYTIEENTVMSQAQVPTMHNSLETITMRHREYIGDVYSGNTPGAFNQNVYPINPGLAGTFSFLSGIAQQFQEYHFTGLMFEIVSTSATALVSGTNTAIGTTMMAFDYTSSDVGFPNKISLLNEMWSVDAKISENIIMPVECSAKLSSQRNLFVRGPNQIGLVYNTAANQINQVFDARVYDVGQLIVATAGIQGNNIRIGELWVTYEIELLKPRLSSSEGFLIPGMYLVNNGTFSDATPLGGLNTDVISDTLGGFNNTTLYPSTSLGVLPGGISVAGNHNIYFSRVAGFFEVTIVWSGTVHGGTGWNPPGLTVLGMTLIDSVQVPLPLIGSFPASAAVHYIVYIPDPTEQTISMAFDNAGKLPGGTAGPGAIRMWVSQIAYSRTGYE